VQITDEKCFWMKCFFPLLLTSIFFQINFLSAQHISFTHYVGKINDKYGVEVQLGCDSMNNLKGSYHYLKKNESIALEGNISSDSIIALKEFADELTGTWNGKMKSDGSITGSWKSADGKKTFPFFLDKKCDETGLCFEHFSGQSFAAYYYSSDTIWYSPTEITLGEKIDEDISKDDTFQLGTEFVGWDFLYVNGGNKKIRDKIDSIILPEYFLYYQNRKANEKITDEQANDGAKKLRDTLAQIDMQVEYDDSGKVLLRNYFDIYQKTRTNVVWDAMGILCVERFGEEFTGGIHELHHSTFYNFDCRTGSLIQLTDVFLAGYEDSVQHKLQEGIVGDGKDESGCLTMDSIPIAENFILTSEGIRFYYNTYEITYYMCGEYDLLIPWSELNQYINPKGPMGWARK
jgi:hypothetical protein